MAKYYVTSGDLSVIIGSALNALDAAAQAVANAPLGVMVSTTVNVDERGFRPRRIEEGEEILSDEVIESSSFGDYLCPTEIFKVEDLFTEMGMDMDQQARDEFFDDYPEIGGMDDVR